MAIRITGDMMVLETGNCVAAIARLSEHAAAGAGTARGSSRLTQFVHRGQAVTALTIAELGSRYSDSHPLVVVLQEELRYPAGSSGPQWL